MLHISLLCDELKTKPFSLYTIDLIKRVTINPFLFLQFSEWQHIVGVAVFGWGKASCSYKAALTIFLWD